MDGDQSKLVLFWKDVQCFQGSQWISGNRLWFPKRFLGFPEFFYVIDVFLSFLNFLRFRKLFWVCGNFFWFPEIFYVSGNFFGFPEISSVAEIFSLAEIFSVAGKSFWFPGNLCCRESHVISWKLIEHIIWKHYIFLHYLYDISLNLKIVYFFHK